MAVSVRLAVQADAERVAKFAIKLFAQHREYDPVRFVSLSDTSGAAGFYGTRMKAEGSAVLVAELDGQVVGFAYLEFEAMNYSGLLENAVWLHDIYIDESARGTGAGRELIKAAAEEAKSLGAGKLMLSVAAQNNAAKAFFEGFGFRTTMHEMMLDLGSGF
jgi:GNAT superfamily N-acetyltransferase